MLFLDIRAMFFGVITSPKSIFPARLQAESILASLNVYNIEVRKVWGGGGGARGERMEGVRGTREIPAGVLFLDDSYTLFNVHTTGTYNLWFYGLLRMFLKLADLRKE